RPCLETAWPSSPTEAGTLTRCNRANTSATRPRPSRWHRGLLPHQDAGQTVVRNTGHTRASKCRDIAKTADRRSTWRSATSTDEDRSCYRETSATVLPAIRDLWVATPMARVAGFEDPSARDRIRLMATRRRRPSVFPRCNSRLRGKTGDRWSQYLQEQRG